MRSMGLIGGWNFGQSFEIGRLFTDLIDVNEIIDRITDLPKSLEQIHKD